MISKVDVKIGLTLDPNHQYYNHTVLISHYSNVFCGNKTYKNKNTVIYSYKYFIVFYIFICLLMRIKVQKFLGLVRVLYYGHEQNVDFYLHIYPSSIFLSIYKSNFSKVIWSVTLK